MDIRTLAKQARLKRNCLLDAAVGVLNRHRNQVDFGVNPSLGPDEVNEVAHFAQSLRDVPQQMDFPSLIIWPNVPRCLQKQIVA